MTVLNDVSQTVPASLLTALSGMSREDMIAKVAQLEAANAALKAGRNRKLTMKVSEKGALSVYGMGRFPVSLYRGQWERLLDSADDIRAFILANADMLSVKE